jgi:hypothetical protein
MNTDNQSALMLPLPIFDCGGKRSATPLSEAARRAKSGVAAQLCHRSPNFHLCLSVSIRG